MSDSGPERNAAMFTHDRDPYDLDDHRPRRVTDADRELAAGCREVIEARVGRRGDEDEDGVADEVRDAARLA